MSEFGDDTLDLVNSALDEGAEHIVLLMRHSAREFEPNRHDLANPLTEEGRTLSTRLGELLPKSLLLRGYASPAERCVDTANLILSGHQNKGGETTRTRPVEALGVFYILDQMRMFRFMESAGGLAPMLKAWFEKEIPQHVMIPGETAARLVFDFAADKLQQPLNSPQLDILVSHDMTIYTVRDQLLGQATSDFPVEFLDGLIIYERDGKRFLQSHHGAARAID